jgi:hypothetical protein
LPQEKNFNPDHGGKKGFGAIEKQCELVYEVAQRGFTARSAFIGFGGKDLPGKTHSVNEVGVVEPAR